MAMVERALDAIPGYPFLPCPICGGVEGCDHGVVERATAYEEKTEAARAHDVGNSEELIRGMTEMAQRFTARMDTAGEQIDELRECLILAVKELECGPPVSVYTKFICVRARKALGLSVDDRVVETRDVHNKDVVGGVPCPNCGGHGMVGRPLDDDPGARCEDCNGTGRVPPSGASPRA